MGVSKLIYNNETLVDLTDTSVSSLNLHASNSAHDAKGDPVIGAAASSFPVENALVDGTFSGVYTNDRIKILGNSSSFRGLTNITKAILPEVTTLNGYDFDGCAALESVELPKLANVTTAGYNFRGTAIQSFTWNLTTEIPQYCFANCASLTNLYAPNVTSVARYALDGSGITTVNDAMFPKHTGRVVFGTGNKTIVHVKLSGDGIRLDDGSGPFRNCSNLETLEFPNATTHDMGNFFAGGCPKLYLFDIGKSNIGSNGCNGDYALTTVILRSSTVVTLQLSGFTNTPFRGYNGLIGTAYVPASLIESYKTATNWSTLYEAGTCSFAAIEGSQYEL